MAKFQDQMVKTTGQGKKLASDAYSSVSSTASKAYSFVSSSATKAYSSAKSSITGEKPPPTGTMGKVQSWWKGKDPTPGSSSLYDNVLTQKLNKTFTPNTP